MESYNRPSPILTSPHAISPSPQPPQEQPSRLNSSSSSSIVGPHIDDSQLYSPAEVRSIDPVLFDVADTAQPQPAYTLPSGAAAPTRSSSRWGRRTEVSIVGDPPSVSAAPLEQAQESVRQFSSTAPLPAGPEARGSPPDSAAELIHRYTSKYHGGVEASLHYVLAIMNPASGETGVSQVVLAGLRDELGVKRVLSLTGELFADPAPIRLLIKEQAVIYHPHGQPRRQQRGTVVVCGGDGTVSFIMAQIDLVQGELEAEFQPFLTAQEVAQVKLYRESSTAGRCLPDLKGEAAHPYFTLPALAPLPLGTGNDYSNCVGFGNGFSPSGSGCCAGLWALCGCGDGGESQVAVALMSAVSAPCVAFDRWEVSLVPLHLAQRTLRAELQSASRVSVDAAFHGILEKRNNNSSSSGAAPLEGGDGSPPTTAPPLTAGNETPVSSPSFVAPNKDSRVADQWKRVVRASNVANAVHLVDWAKLYASKQVSTYSMINYFSVGYDAYVTNKFDATRRAHPAVCSTRTQNKAVYLSFGIGCAMKCKKLQKLIPMICVPRPKHVPSIPNTNHNSTASITATATSPAPPAVALTPSPSLTNISDSANDSRDFTALQLPAMTKSLVVSNVNCYGAGTHPWNPRAGELYYRPVTMRNGELVAAPVTTAPNKEEVPRPVTINDRNFEVQAMGGLLHYSSLGVGMSGAIKLLQTHELFAFVLCTPEDLRFPSGQCSTYTQIQLKKKYVSRIETDASLRASLCVQIDGEVMPSITEPTIVHLRRQQGSHILIRCRNMNVVVQ